MFRNIMLNCEQATLLLIKKKEEPFSLEKKLKLFLHLLFCDPCKRFKTQTAVIDETLHKCREHFSKKPPHRLTEQTKERIQQLVNNLH